MTADRVLRRGLGARRAQLMQRLRLMLVNAAEDDEEDDGFEIALEALYDEFEFLAALEGEIMRAEMQALELKAIARR